MNAQRIRVKVYLETPDVELHAFVPVFHRWIQKRALDEVMIDVADYSHVHEGPGVLLICHSANYAIDLSSGRPGLVYSRKRDAFGTWEERVLSSFRAALLACKKLESEPSLAGKVRFSTKEMLFRIHDRLHAPNVPATRAAIEPGLGNVCTRLLGSGAFELSQTGEPDEPFAIAIRASGQPPPVAELLARI